MPMEGQGLAVAVEIWWGYPQRRGEEIGAHREANSRLKCQGHAVTGDGSGCPQC